MIVLLLKIWCLSSIALSLLFFLLIFLLRVICQKTLKPTNDTYAKSGIREIEQRQSLDVDEQEIREFGVGDWSLIELNPNEGASAAPSDIQPVSISTIKTQSRSAILSPIYSCTVRVSEPKRKWLSVLFFARTVIGNIIGRLNNLLRVTVRGTALPHKQEKSGATPLPATISRSSSIGEAEKPTCADVAGSSAVASSSDETFHLPTPNGDGGGCGDEPGKAAALESERVSSRPPSLRCKVCGEPRPCACELSFGGAYTA